MRGTSDMYNRPRDNRSAKLPDPPRPQANDNILFSITQHEADEIIYNLLSERYDFLLRNSSRDGRMWDKVCYLMNVYKGKVGNCD
jgi:hypothetical protein